MRIFGWFALSVVAIPVLAFGGAVGLKALAGLLILLGLCMGLVESRLRAWKRKRALAEQEREQEEKAKKGGYIYIG